MSNKVRDDCFKFWRVSYKGGWWLPCKCKTCKGHLFNSAIVPWEAAHLVPRANGGSDDPTNVVPMQYDCHRHETATIDVPAIAKGKRTAAKHFGVKRKGAFRKQPPAPPGMKYNAWARRFEPI